MTADHSEEILAGWFDLAARVYDAGMAVLNAAARHAEAADDVKIIAASLLARTLSNFNAGVELLHQGFIVEARTLMRCCFENLFWIGALDKTEADFIEAIKADDALSRMRRAKWLEEWQERSGAPATFDIEAMRTYAAQLKQKYPKAAFVSFGRIAEESATKDAYIFYSQLSVDAAHPSETSLNRYISRDKAGRATLDPAPKERLTEKAETLEFGCNALIGVAVGVNGIFGTEIQQGLVLGRLFEEYRQLSKDSHSNDGQAQS